MTIYNCFVFQNYINYTTFFNIFNGWVEVQPPPKKFKKFKIGDGNEELHAQGINAQGT